MIPTLEDIQTKYPNPITADANEGTGWECLICGASMNREVYG